MQKEKTNLLKNTKWVFANIHKQEKGFLLINFVSCIFTAINMFIIPYLLKIIIDIITNNQFNTKEDLMTLIVKVLICLIIKVIIMTISTWVDMAMTYKIISVRTKVLIEKNEKIFSLDYETLENPDMLDAIDKAGYSLGGNWDGYEGMYNYAKDIFTSLISVVLASAIIFQSHFLIIIIVILLVITKYLLENHTNKIDKKRFWDVAPKYRRKLNYINNISRNFSVSKDIRIYNMKSFIEQSEKEVQKDLHNLLIERENRYLKLQTLLTILSIIQEIAIYAILIYQVLNNKLEIGNFTFMLTSVRTLSSHLGNMFWNFSEINICSREVNDLRWLMEYVDEVSNKQVDVLEKDFQIKTIEFRHVYYKYLNASDYTLKDISFTLSYGEKIALVGYNGAGKTTLIKLMLGLYHPTKGEILINGKNIDTIERKSYFRLFAPVFQDIIAFNFEIRENVAMRYQDKVDDELVDNALYLAGLKEKVDTLPDKARTILLKELDDNGIELSGGEMQKLGLARAIYKKSQIVILDEPTSALDALAESKMYANFNQIIGSAGAIYISHRLASTYFCDYILLLSSGKIIESGTHDELMKKQGEYFNLFSLQAKYYKEEDDNNE